MAASKKYQPDRPDIFINTDWGIPREDVSADEAAQRNLILFKNRWVTSTERDLLKRQRRAYRAIRILSGFMMGVSAMSCLPAFLIISWWSVESKWWLLGITKIDAAVFYAVVAITMVCAMGLWAFKKWAWQLGKVLFVYVPGLFGVVCVALVVTDYPIFETSPVIICFVLFSTAAPILRNKTTRNIFAMERDENAQGEFKWYKTTYGELMILSPLITLAVFVALFVQTSGVRLSCDELARKKLNSLSGALSKLESELTEHNCPNTEEILKGLSEDQLK